MAKSLPADIALVVKLTKKVQQICTEVMNCDCPCTARQATRLIKSRDAFLREIRRVLKAKSG